MTSTTTPLLPHQQAAVDKLMPSRIGALFMEMGTGKTRTAIEMIVHRQSRISNVVWFCPVSLKDTIRHEIMKHTDTPPDSIHVFNGKTGRRTAPPAFWYVVGIESMSASRRVILTVNALVNENSMVIVDESSYIKGHASARTSWITRIAERARYRLILTGTPLSQGVVDLFSQMRFLSPKILGYRSFYSFAANHLEYSDKYPGLIVRSHNTAYLAAKIKPYVYQVTKRECLDLPEKLYDSQYFTMSREQRAAYETAKEEILRDVENDEFDSFTIFRLFTALQQIVCGFWNRIDLKTKEEDFQELPHDRIDMLLDIVGRVPESEKIIVWAKYQYDIDRIRRALIDTCGDGCVALFYGAINERNRAAEVVRFRNGARFFLATQSCGGHGLTLNEAHHVIFYNNGFKYSERLQAEDRCHRIGQAHPVTYIDIVCSGSIDERIDSALARKGNAVEEFKAEIERVKGSKKKLSELIRAL